MPDYEVIKKKVKAQKVLSIRRILPNFCGVSDRLSPFYMIRSSRRLLWM
jgi:hypothetical protein